MYHTLLTTIFVIVGILGCLAIPTVPSLLGWELVNTNGFHPSPRAASGEFVINDKRQMGLFGGLKEAIAINRGDNIFYNDLFLYDVDTTTWTQLHNGLGVAPSVRAYSCSGYHKGTNSIYVFGGVNVTKYFEGDFKNDIWRFNLTSSEWEELLPIGDAPSPRASCACTVIGDDMYVFSGYGPNFASDNELWRYRMNIDDGFWTKISDNTDSALVPKARTQSACEQLSSTKFVVHGGDGFEFIAEEPYIKAVTFGDVWVFDTTTLSWSQLDSSSGPVPHRTQVGSAVLSERYMITQNGDSQGNKTIEDTCKPPLECLIPATPTSGTFLYDFRHQSWAELDLSSTVPSTRRSMMVKVGDELYFFGGYGWDGQNGVGEIWQPYTWKMTTFGSFSKN